jgi:hypothetical protein
MVTFAAHCDLNPRTQSTPVGRGKLVSHGVFHARTNGLRVARSNRFGRDRDFGNRASACESGSAGGDLSQRAEGRRTAGKALVLPHRAALDA